MQGERAERLFVFGGGTGECSKKRNDPLGKRGAFSQIIALRLRNPPASSLQPPGYRLVSCTPWFRASSVARYFVRTASSAAAGLA